MKVLILGSFPGEESLRKQQYYAYAQNQFWEIIFKIIGKELPWKCEDRTQALNKAGIGLWDVIGSCAREGSSDQNIKEPEINDFEFLNKCPKLKGIFFNGRTAEDLFDKHYEVSGLKKKYLPSTSPLNTQRKIVKLRSWRKIKDLLK